MCKLVEGWNLEKLSIRNVENKGEIVECVLYSRSIETGLGLAQLIVSLIGPYIERQIHIGLNQDFSMEHVLQQPTNQHHVSTAPLALSVHNCCYI
jgi:hypothetical protein